jgi:hypothetical protein
MQARMRKYAGQLCLVWHLNTESVGSFLLSGSPHQRPVRRFVCCIPSCTSFRITPRQLPRQVSLHISHLVSACLQVTHRFVYSMAPVQMCRTHVDMLYGGTMSLHALPCGRQCTFEVQAKLWTDGAQMQYDPPQRASCLVRAHVAADPRAHPCSPYIAAHLTMLLATVTGPICVFNLIVCAD